MITDPSVTQSMYFCLVEERNQPDFVLVKMDLESEPSAYEEQASRDDAKNSCSDNREWDAGVVASQRQVINVSSPRKGRSQAHIMIFPVFGSLGKGISMKY